MMSAEDDQKLRRRARNHRYRQGKGKKSDVFSFHVPWTVIGAWTAIGDGPLIVDHCVVK